mmetsp:Transcript_13168/g.16518  ORF Transcript_13168/g.16518 Transcript_13168/m.16518 type:complete len:98 (+) Transcript_13168:268-561(+)
MQANTPHIYRTRHHGQLLLLEVEHQEFNKYRMCINVYTNNEGTSKTLPVREMFDAGALLLLGCLAADLPLTGKSITELVLPRVGISSITLNQGWSII